MLVSVPQSKLLSSIAFVDNFILNVAKEWSVHFGFKPTDLATKHGIPRLIVSHHLSVSLRKGSYWIKLFHVLPVSLVDLNVFPPTTQDTLTQNQGQSQRGNQKEASTLCPYVPQPHVCWEKTHRQEEFVFQPIRWNINTQHYVLHFTFTTFLEDGYSTPTALPTIGWKTNSSCL